jgi:hypothetical protein
LGLYNAVREHYLSNAVRQDDPKSPHWDAVADLHFLKANVDAQA